MSGRRRGKSLVEDEGVDDPVRTLVVPSARYMRIQKFSDLTGYTAKAVARKIEDGIWIEGREYRRAPDGNICIDLEGFYRWVEAGRVLASRR